MSPSRLWVVGCALWLAASFVAAFQPDWLRVWLGAGIALALGAGVDALLALGLGPLEAVRKLSGTLALGVASPVELELTNRGAWRLHARVYDHLPPALATHSLPRKLVIGAREKVYFAYELVPIERGAHTIARLEVVARSPLGFWRRRLRAGSAAPVRVFPNFRAVAHYALLAAENRAGQIGVRRFTRRGAGLEFQELREYRAGDSLRQIDWKATARIGRAISREYQDERDQRVVFMLDCGRKMNAKSGELSHLDHALDALLLLGHVALRQGDSVGLFAFGGEPRWIAPLKGGAQLTRLMNAVYDLRSSTRASDYQAAAEQLSLRLRRRALVIVVSNLRDDDHAEIAGAVRLLRRKHLVLVASFRERELAAPLEAPVRTLDDALLVAATHQYLNARTRSHALLRSCGVMVLDAEPTDLPVALVNGYLDLKAAGRL